MHGGTLVHLIMYCSLWYNDEVQHRTFLDIPIKYLASSDLSLAERAAASFPSWHWYVPSRKKREDFFFSVSAHRVQLSSKHASLRKSMIFVYYFPWGEGWLFLSENLGLEFRLQNPAKYLQVLNSKRPP